MSLIAWSWLFLVAYIGGMLAIGVVAQRRVKHADDFATARQSYGPLFLALAFAATTASGATFMGTPGLSYEWGLPTIWGAFLYPTGVYLGVLIAMRLVTASGHRFGNRSIPEYLGDRYRSEGIRVLVAVFSLLLCFYLAGQLVSGLVMFEILLGLPPVWALGITATVLLVYVVLGGAHADILTDGVQGCMMLLVAAVVIGLFLTGFGVAAGEAGRGGVLGLIDNLGAQDADLVGLFNATTPLYHSWWSVFAILVSHVPLGLLPHLGNKLWALKNARQQRTFIGLAFSFGLTLGMLGLAGLSARALLGDALYAEGANPNQALPLLFIEVFPTWLAALVGVGILAAIMSTADGLVISSSQIIANDLYRRTVVPRLTRPAGRPRPHRPAHQPRLDRRRAAAVHHSCLGAGRDQHRADRLDRERRADGGVRRPAGRRRAVARRDPHGRVCRIGQRFRHLFRAAYPNARSGLVRARNAARRSGVALRRRPQSFFVRDHRRIRFHRFDLPRLQGNAAAPRHACQGTVRRPLNRRRSSPCHSSRGPGCF